MPEGTKDDPWELSTAPGTSNYTMWSDEIGDPPTLFCQVGSTQLKSGTPPQGLSRSFRMYVPPLLEALGKVELTHEARNNKVRAIV